VALSLRLIPINHTFARLRAERRLGELIAIGPIAETLSVHQ
jgi:hypothetical protein